MPKNPADVDYDDLPSEKTQAVVESQDEAVLDFDFPDQPNVMAAVGEAMVAATANQMKRLEDQILSPAPSREPTGIIELREPYVKQFAEGGDDPPPTAADKLRKIRRRMAAHGATLARISKLLDEVAVSIAREIEVLDAAINSDTE